MATATRDTRQVILFAAAELFRKQGYAATTMQHVAEATGISKGNLTYHFPSKQALYREVHNQAIDYICGRVLGRSFDEAPDALVGFSEFTRRLRRWLIDEAGHFVGCLFTNIAVETQHSDQAIGQLAREALARFKRELTARLAEGQARGQVRGDLPAEQLATTYFWMYEGALTLSRAMDDPAEYDQFRALVPGWLAPPAPAFESVP
jgi:AcrR family transcriptional regulator